MIVTCFIGILIIDILLYSGSSLNDASFALQPKFTAPIVNLSVAIGRDATFKCLVHQLGKYKVGWVKADTKAIQAIDKTVITHNSRVSVSHEGYGVWNLHIRDVKEEDRGLYMCQINTDPMASQTAVLDVLHPPDFIASLTAGDTLVAEGSSIRLRCAARGRPEPRVLWRREDAKEIIIRSDDRSTKVLSYQGEVLKLSKISRHDMGAYMCIASNGVPPTISKRIVVHVHFPPVIHVPNQLVGAPLGTHVTLECHVEASPAAINYWIRDTGEILSSNSKYDVHLINKSLFEVRMLLTIRKLLRQDLGTYQCIAKNSLGEVDSNIRLYEIPGPTKHISLFNYDEPDLINQLTDKEEQQEDYELYKGAKIRHSKHANRLEANNIRTELTKVSKLNYLENYVPIEQKLSPESMSGSVSQPTTYCLHILTDIIIFYNTLFI